MTHYCLFIPPVVNASLYVPTAQTELINFPNQWVADQEYDFGNGLYGKRIAGTITVAANTQNILPVVASGVTSIVDSGGCIGEGDTATPAIASVGHNVVTSSGTVVLSSDVRLVNSTGALNIASRSANTRSNNPNSRYDIWVRYTK
jgi:hypothetical protein